MIEAFFSSNYVQIYQWNGMESQEIDPKYART